jgi:hypothetical protein
MQADILFNGEWSRQRGASDQEGFEALFLEGHQSD